MVMASLSHHPLSLLFLGLLFASVHGSSSTQLLGPASFDCGNGVRIHYPFWLQSQQNAQYYSGYPGFSVSCHDQNPTLHLSNDIHFIKEINYSNRSLTLAYTKFQEPGACPRATPDVAPSNSTMPSVFNFTIGNKMLHFFYNCTLYPPSLADIACLADKAKRSYVFIEGKIPEFDWHRYCQSVVTVPVMDEPSVDRDVVQGFVSALQSGFLATWQQPTDVACKSCETTGGYCGYRNSTLGRNFICICADGTHSPDSCDYKGEDLAVSARPNELEPNYIAIGAVTFGGLVVAATAFYFIRKKKVGSYEPV